MAGVINPTMISGMEKLRNWPKTSLKVTKIRVAQVGRTDPSRIPSAMATTIRGRTPNLNPVLFSVLIPEP
jgi:hypothetical protein